MQQIALNQVASSRQVRRLLISEEYYEYCVVPSYRELETFSAYLVGIMGFYAKVVYQGSKLIIVSLIFPKGWRVEEIAEWLYESAVCIAQESEDGYFVEGAEHILGGVFFKGSCIVAYVPGKEKVYCWEDTYVDAGKLYGEGRCVVDLMFPNPTSSIVIGDYQEKYMCNSIDSATNIEEIVEDTRKVHIEVQGNAKVIVTIA